MTPCKDIVKILSSGEPISFLKRMEIRMHLAMCEHCSVYAKQLHMMKDSFIKLFKKKTEVRADDIESLEKTIIEKISKKIK